MTGMTGIVMDTTEMVPPLRSRRWNIVTVVPIFAVKSRTVACAPHARRDCRGVGRGRG